MKVVEKEQQETVIDIKKCLYLNGENVPCVVIENDKMEKVVKKVLIF